MSICGWKKFLRAASSTAPQARNLCRTTNHQPSPAFGILTGMVIGMTIFFFVAFVLVPALWIFFYGSRHVKATCEARDPVTRWTDACPLPVLAICLWTWLVDLQLVRTRRLRSFSRLDNAIGQILSAVNSGIHIASP